MGFQGYGILGLFILIGIAFIILQLGFGRPVGPDDFGDKEGYNYENDSYQDK